MIQNVTLQGHGSASFWSQWADRVDLHNDMVILLRTSDIARENVFSDWFRLECKRLVRSHAIRVCAAIEAWED